jgi:cellulose biosynthesis protein BcsQ
MVYDRLFQDRTSKKLLEGASPEALIVGAKKNIDIIPADLSLIGINNVPDTLVRGAIKRSGIDKRYDAIIIDPPGYWGSHTRNAVLAADVIVVSGCCSKLDYAATEMYVETLNQLYFETPPNVYVAINAYNTKTSDLGALQSYRDKFAHGDFLTPEPIPCIQSLKRIISNVNYPLHPSVQVRMDRYVDHITGGRFHGETRGE